MVDWVSSSLSERSCRLVFQGFPKLTAPVSLGTPPESPISPLLFLLYISPAHATIPRGFILSYLDNIAITVASDSHWATSAAYKLSSQSSSRKDRTWWSLSLSRRPKSYTGEPPAKEPHNQPPPIELDGYLFYPTQPVRWLGYWKSPALTSTYHFTQRLSLAQAAFAFVK